MAREGAVPAARPVPSQGFISDVISAGSLAQESVSLGWFAVAELLKQSRGTE